MGLGELMLVGGGEGFMVVLEGGELLCEGGVLFGECEGFLFCGVELFGEFLLVLLFLVLQLLY